MFRITKKFTGGNLEGIEISEVSAVKYEVGTVVSAPVAGSPYIVTSCVEDDSRSARALQLSEAGFHDDAYLVQMGWAD